MAAAPHVAAISKHEVSPPTSEPGGERGRETYTTYAPPREAHSLVVHHITLDHSLGNVDVPRRRIMDVGSNLAGSI